jgi:hypothetical protein
MPGTPCSSSGGHGPRGPAPCGDGPGAARLTLRPRSVLLGRLEVLLAAAGPRLDRLDPPPEPPEPPQPVLRPRLVGREIPRADHA